MDRKVVPFISLLLVVFLLAACGSEPRGGTSGLRAEGLPQDVGGPVESAESGEELAAVEIAPLSEDMSVAAPTGELVSASSEVEPSTGQEAATTVSFTLETTMENGLAFKGVGGEIDGVINPELRVPAGAQVELTLVNGDGMQHDLVVDAFGAKTPQFMEKGASETITFVADASGEYEYYCSVPGHLQAGMVGKFIVEGEAGQQASSESEEVDHAAGGAVLAPESNVVHPPAVEGAPVIAADPNVVAAPVGEREPETVHLDLVTTEVDAQLADGTTYNMWTFNGTVPGPLLRVRVGDTVEVRLKNAEDSAFAHSIDFHAMTGFHGGGAVSQAAPGEEKVFTFTALNPGVYVYHCATPIVPHHIANGMYGLIVVEPEGGLPPVDREFYVMQGEVYTTGKPGDTGHLEFDVDKMLAEQPNYLVFNGSTDALTKDLVLRANVGETVRIYMGVGGPNLTSSFHVIGEVFDRVYDLAAITSEPLTNVQTVSVPPGGATVVEFEVEQPGSYVLVDHALGRLVKGLKAYLIVEGEENPAISHEGPAN